MRTLLTAGVVLFGLSGFHLQMIRSLPSADSTVTESPSEVRLWFNERPELAVSRITVTGPDGAIAAGRPQATDDTLSFAVGVPVSLAAGAYTVAWRTAGGDGHVLRGSYEFRVDASGARR